MLGTGSFLLSKALHIFFPTTVMGRESGNKCYKPGSWSRDWAKHQKNPFEPITIWKSSLKILSKFVCTGWKKWYFHWEGIKWIHADDRYLSCFANSKSSFQRSGICTNPHLSLKQLADLCFSEAECSVEPLLFICVSKQVCVSVHKHTWGVIQIMLYFQSGCCFWGYNWLAACKGTTLGPSSSTC